MKKQKNLLSLLFFLVFVFSLYQIITTIISNNENNKIYDDIIGDIKIEEINSETDKGTTTFINVDFANLLVQNPDTKGWISLNEINYPFVQSKDNVYYLKRAFDKKSNVNGTIFMDYRNNGFDDNNIVIYGHNSSNNQMFGSLKKFLKKDYFANDGNSIIRISTVSANYNFKIFSVYTIEKEDYYITTSFSATDFEKFINTIIKRSYYKFADEVNVNDKVLTLSTCNGGSAKRLVIHAKLIETELR